MVWKLKFGRAQSCGAEIAKLTVERLRLNEKLAGRHVDLLVTHAPTATSRVRQRGYDQAALIAKSLASNADIPCASLLRRRGHQEQIGATKQQRAMQLAGAFYTVRQDKIVGKHIILVDDVITTGATLESAARVLLDVGARRVDAIVFAQA